MIKYTNGFTVCFNKSYMEDPTIWFPKSEDLFSCDWEIANIGERDPKLLPH